MGQIDPMGLGIDPDFVRIAQMDAIERKQGAIESRIVTDQPRVALHPGFASVIRQSISGRVERIGAHRRSEPSQNRRAITLAKVEQSKGAVPFDQRPITVDPNGRTDQSTVTEAMQDTDLSRIAQIQYPHSIHPRIDDRQAPFSPVVERQSVTPSQIGAVFDHVKRAVFGDPIDPQRPLSAKIEPFMFPIEGDRLIFPFRDGEGTEWSQCVAIEDLQRAVFEEVEACIQALEIVDRFVDRSEEAAGVPFVEDPQFGIVGIEEKELMPFRIPTQRVGIVGSGKTGDRLCRIRGGQVAQVAVIPQGPEVFRRRSNRNDLGKIASSAGKFSAALKKRRPSPVGSLENRLCPIGPAKRLPIPIEAKLQNVPMVDASVAVNIPGQNRRRLIVDPRNQPTGRRRASKPGGETLVEQFAHGADAYRGILPQIPARHQSPKYPRGGSSRDEARAKRSFAHADQIERVVVKLGNFELEGASASTVYQKSALSPGFQDVEPDPGSRETFGFDRHPMSPQRTERPHKEGEANDRAHRIISPIRSCSWTIPAALHCSRPRGGRARPCLCHRFVLDDSRGGTDAFWGAATADAGDGSRAAGPGRRWFASSPAAIGIGPFFYA